MKKIALIALCILGASNLYAATPGAYVGAGLGASRLDTPSRPNLLSGFATYTHTQNRIGLGERIFAGYNLKTNLGAELGISNYAQSKYNGYTYNGDYSWKYNLAAISLVAKAYLPISDTGVNLYGLGGAALVHSTDKSSNNSIAPFYNTSSTTQNRLRPMYGVGVSYDNKTKVTPSLEYSHIEGMGDLNASDGIPSADMVSLNLAFKLS